MPARICQRTSRRKAASSSSPSAVNGVTSAVNAPRRRGRVGRVAVRAVGQGGSWSSWSSWRWCASSGCSFQGSRVGRGGQAAMAGRARSSSTMGSKGWRPAGAARAIEPVGGGEDPGRIGGPVAGGQPQLDGLADGIEPDEVHPGRRAGADRDDLEVVGRRAGAGWPSTIRPARSRAVPDGRSSLARRATRRGTDRTPSTGPNSATAASTSRPNSATPRLKFGAGDRGRAVPGGRPSTAAGRRSSRSWR